MHTKTILNTKKPNTPLLALTIAPLPLLKLRDPEVAALGREELQLFPLGDLGERGYLLEKG